MIGASVMGRFFGGAPEPRPAPAEAPSDDLAAVTELRCALALYDVADELYRNRDGAERAPGRDRLAHIYATWMLARAARRLVAVHDSATGAGGSP